MRRRRRSTKGVRLALAALAARLGGGGPLAARALGVAAVAVAALAVPARALATEPKKPSEPHIMSEPGEVTNVVDAFDDENDNPFDIHITLGYQYSSLGAKIHRETSINQPGLSGGGFTTNLMNVAQYKEVTSRLNTRIDVGIYKDIALFLRLPLILSNTRDLTDLGGSAGAQGVVLQAARGEQQLFSLPFHSPTRSGIEYLAVGFDFGIFNQARDSSKPTWIFGAEGRFSVSEAMHACSGAEGTTVTGINQKSPQVACADPADINRTGVPGSQDKDPNTLVDPNNKQSQSLKGEGGARKAGVSRGTTAIEIHSVMSRRVKYVEPYGGFRALLEFANNGGSDFGQTNLSAVLTSSPPLQGSMIAGMLFIPYEQRELYQKLTFDLRFTGTYRSEGRDYSPLFDALGSSDALSVRRPNFASYSGRPSVVDPSSQKVYVTGLTDTAAHGSFQVSGSAQFQAAQFIKFQVGLGLTYIQSHNITGDQPCNPNFQDDATKAGPCQLVGQTKTTVSGIPNPLYRPVTDIVGRRFVMDGAMQVDGWLHAVVMF